MAASSSPARKAPTVPATRRPAKSERIEVRATERQESVIRQAAAAPLIHRRDAAAEAFSRANGDFVASPVEPSHLLLSMRGIRRRLGM